MIFRRASFRIGLLVGLVGALISAGLAYGYFAINELNWRDSTVRNARVVSDTIQSWLEDTYSDLSALAVLIENSNHVDKGEFANAIDGMETRRVTHFMGEKALVRRDRDRWLVHYSSITNSANIPDEGREIWEKTELGQAIIRASDQPNEWVLSRPVKQADGKTFVYCLLALGSRSDFILAGVIEFADIMRAIMDIRVPKGVGLEVFMSVGTDDRPTAAFSAKPDGEVVAVSEVRLRTGSTDILSRVLYTDEYIGGRQIKLALLLFLGGLVATSLLVWMVIYLQEQTEIVGRKVQQATRELSTERSLLRSLIDSIPDIISVKDAKGIYSIVNKTYAEFLGRPMEQVVGRKMSDLFDPEIADRFAAQDEQAIKSGTITATEDRVNRADGTIAFFDTAKIPLIAPDGEVQGIIAVGRDITERKQVETALKTFKFTLDNAADGILLINEKGLITYANEKMCELSGYSAEALIGSSIEAHFVETAEVGWAERWAAFRAASRPAPFERTLVDASDRKISCEIVSRFMRFGDQEFVCSFIRDISERKRAEGELRRVHYALEHASDGVVWVDANGQVVETNLSFAKMVGTERDDLFGRFIGEFYDGVTFENWQGIWREIAKRESDLPVEQNLRRSDGSVMAVEVLSRFISFGGGDYICAFTRDIRKRKKAEKQILKAKEAAEEATRAKSSFLAMMSHEIRTPMNGVMSMAEMLMSTRLDEDQRDIAKVILSSADALLTIINDILDFSKIEAGKLDIEKVPFDILPTVESAGELVAQRAHDKNVRLYMEVDPAIPLKLVGDPNRIRQIILNLAGNAVKFTEKGHVFIGVQRVDLGGASANVRLRFEIRDTGIGLTEDQAGRLFQPFQQADVSTSRKFGGTGLGLSISKRLTEMMQGEIGVTSVFGQGSTFWFEIPFAVADPGLHKPPADLQQMGVVAIGFDETGLALVSRYLEGAGVGQVRFAGHHNYESVIQSFGPEANPVVALMLLRDSVLAVEAMNRLAALERSNLKVIVATPRSMISTIGHVKGKGADAILPLPLPRNLLWRALAVMSGKLASDSEIEERSSLDADWEPPSVEEARAAGALILVAEDNKTNQHVIKRILSRLGYAHELANDGLEALELYRASITSKPYGLILSDYHMPNMDGFGLTTAIREIEASRGGHLPIIALTADAMASTEKHCRDAGMDGFLAKPIKVDALRSALEHWLPQGRALRRHPGAQPEVHQDVSEPASVPVASPSSGGGIDPDIFDQARLAETFGSFNEDARNFLTSFTGDALDMIGRVQAAIEKADFKRARDEVHALKGASRSMGVNRVGNVAADIQSCLDAGDHETAQILCPALRAAYDEFKTAIAAI